MALTETDKLLLLGALGTKETTDRVIQLLNSAGTGNVSGPGSSTDNAIVRFDGLTGAIIQNSGVLLDDSNNISGLVNLTITGKYTAPAGTVGAPSYSLATANSGFYEDVATAVAVSVAGSRVFRFGGLGGNHRVFGSTNLIWNDGPGTAGNIGNTSGNSPNFIFSNRNIEARGNQAADGIEIHAQNSDTTGWAKVSSVGDSGQMGMWSIPSASTLATSPGGLVVVNQGILLAESGLTGGLLVTSNALGSNIKFSIGDLADTTTESFRITDSEVQVNKLAFLMNRQALAGATSEINNGVGDGVIIMSGENGSGGSAGQVRCFGPAAGAASQVRLRSGAADVVIVEPTGKVTLGTGTPTHRLNSNTATIGADVLTLTNGPAGTAGNPDLYLQININGVDYAIPAWAV